VGVRITIGVLVVCSIGLSAEARRLTDRAWSPWAERPAEGHLHAEFTTHFKVRQYDRSANVRRAAKRLHRYELAPYAQLSYNRVVGPRTLDAGFRDAPVIDRGRLTKEPGGGVCQPSSTLHAAALFSGLRIVERKPHTWTSNYIATGLDAAVAWGMKDLVIKNPFAHTMRVAVAVDDTSITVFVFGDEPPRTTYRMSTKVAKVWPYETDETVDPELAPGAERLMLTGLDGLRLERRLSRTIRTRTHTTRLPDDIYYKRDRILRRGPPAPAVIQTAREEMPIADRLNRHADGRNPEEPL